MLADFFTKPLQGELFRKFRDQILEMAPMESIPPVSPPSSHRSVLGNKINRVGKNNFGTRADTRNISTPVRPGDKPGHPGDTKENSAPEALTGTKCSPSHGQKVLVNNYGTLDVKPGCESDMPFTPKILNHLAKLKSHRKGGHATLNKPKKGIKTVTPAGTKVLPAKESAKVTWADIVRLEKRKA